MGHSETCQKMRRHVIKLFTHKTKHERTETVCPLTFPFPYYTLNVCSTSYQYNNTSSVSVED